MVTDGHEQEIRDLVGRWAGAEADGDTDTLDGLLVDDFTAVGPRGFVLDRDAWLERYRSGALRHASFEIRDAQVREYGDAAVVVATQEQTSTYNGHDASASLRATLVAVRDSRRWGLAGVHLSPAPPD